MISPIRCRSTTVWRILVVLATIGVVTPTGSTFAQSFGAKPTDRANAAGDAPANPLAGDQSQVAARFKRLEGVLLRSAEVEATTNPSRAALLQQAAAMAKQVQLSDAMVRAAKSLEQNQYSQAVKDQQDSLDNLEKLLQLLQSENRPERIRKDKDQVRRWIEEADRLLRLQSSLRGRTEGGTQTEKAAGDQQKLAEKAAQIAKELGIDEKNSSDKKPGEDSEKSSDKPNADKDKPSKDSDKPDANKNGSDKPNAEKPEGDKNNSGDENKPGDDQSKSDKNQSDKNQSDKDKSGDKADKDKADSDKANKDQSEKDKSDKEKSDKDQADKDKSGKDSQGKDASKPDEQSKDKSSDPSQGEPSESQSPGQKPKPGEQPGQPQQPSDQQSQPGDQSESESEPAQPQQPQSPTEKAAKRIKEAQKRMQEAKKQLEDAERKGAVEKQRQAEAELQAAIEQLEEILRQLREEEIERSLAALEERIRLMLQLQNKVLDETKRLQEIGAGGTDRQVAIRANSLANEEKKILSEGQRALLLLREEGTSAAFPEALTQILSDMQNVAERLAKADVGKLTVSIEQEIVSSLEELVGALAAVQKEKNDKKQKPPSGPGQQQPSGEKPLVDQLAELRLIKTLQLRINKRTQSLAEVLKDPNDAVGQADADDIQTQLRDLSQRQSSIKQVTRDIVTGKNK